MIEQKDREIANLKDNCETIQSSNDELRLVIEDYKLEMTRLKDQLKQVRAKNRSLNEKNAELQKQRDEEATQLKRTLADLNRQLIRRVGDSRESLDEPEP